MSYKALDTLKKHVELEVLRKMSYDEINDILNDQQGKIFDLEKQLRAARQNTKESPENSPASPVQQTQPAIVLSQDDAESVIREFKELTYAWPTVLKRLVEKSQQQASAQ